MPEIDDIDRALQFHSGLNAENNSEFQPLPIYTFWI